MKKNLYLLRHGQTLFNSKQAKRAGLFFQSKGIHFDHLYCSDLHRAVETSKLVEPNLAPEIKQPLREWFFGYYEAERVAIIPQAPFGDYFCQFGGEAQSTVRTRVFDCIHDIMEQDDTECVLVVSHGRSCKEFYDAVLEEAANPNDKVLATAEQSTSPTKMARSRLWTFSRKRITRKSCSFLRLTN